MQHIEQRVCRTRPCRATRAQGVRSG